MKLDWNLMRTILAHVEAETIEEFVNDANNLDEWKEGQLLSERRNRDQDASIRVVFSHIKLLVDSGYIEGLYVTESADGHFQIGIAAILRSRSTGIRYWRPFEPRGSSTNSKLSPKRKRCL